MRKLLPEKRRTLFIWLVIPLAFYMFVVFGPILNGLYFSFFNWRGGPTMSFSGLDNYVRMINDPGFWQAFRNNIHVILFCLVGQTGLGFFVAVLLSSKFLKLRKVYRYIVFLPVILSGVVVGFLWRMTFNSTFGLLNGLLNFLGLGGLIRNWLGDPSIVMSSISVTLIWQFMGLNVIIFLASLQNIPQEITEASEIDGANAFQKLRYITFPLMYNTIKVAIILCVSGNMRIFDHIQIMTRGGPGTTSSVLSLYAYKISFEMMYFGYGSALAIGIIILSLGLVMLTMLLMRGGSAKHAI